MPTEDTELHTCCDCGDSVEETNSNDRCTPCQDDYYVCESCEDEVHGDDTFSAYDQLYCEECFYDSYDWCSDCGESFHREDLHYQSDELYCEDCRPCEEDDMADSVDRRRIPSSSRIGNSFNYPVHRLVGIEAECLYPETEDMDSPLYWASTHDGSISSEEGYSGIEMVSRPCSGDSIVEAVDKLVMWSNYNGAVVNRSCGLHVHFNSLDLTAKEVCHIAIVYTHFEQVLKGMMPNSRQSSNWCKDFPIPIGYLREIDNEHSLIAYYYDYMESSPSSEKYNDARYCGLNIHSRYYHGSIEFRLHSGTLNKTKILNWVSILNCIIEKGIELSNVDDKKYKKWIGKNPTSQLKEMFGDKLHSYINKRTEKFKGNR